MSYSTNKLKTSRPGRVPSWQMNLLLFGLLTALTMVAFFGQLGKINSSFRRHSLEHSRMVAGVIRQNLRKAILSRRTINEILTTFLGNSARFVTYLDEIEPFNSEELTAFARQAGLAGIIINRHDGEVVSGPAAWFPLALKDLRADGLIRYSGNRRIIFMALPLGSRTGAEGKDMIVVGFKAGRIEILREQTGLKSLLAALSSLPGINYVRFEQTGKDSLPHEEENVNLINNDGKLIAETRLPLDTGQLIVGLDARQYDLRVSALRRQFIMFGCLLAVLGLFFSWLLYRLQKADLKRARDFERMLAREHEAAALGRATATIAHEIRNPLNAIYMGLQRLTLESDNLDRDQGEMLAAMGKAVQRTSKIVSDLQRFAKPVAPNLQAVNPARLVDQAIALYQPMVDGQQIKISKTLVFQGEISADPDLLAELVDNLLKNAIEAQPETGFININLEQRKAEVVLTIVNGGCRLAGDEISRPGEPYFTTKTRGSGLGLAHSRRIVEAHGGKLLISVEDNEIFNVIVILPGAKPE